MQLSKLESKAYETLRNNNMAIFRSKDIMLLLGVSRAKSYNIIKALKRKKAILALKAGLYAVSGTNELIAGSYLNWPSYLSFWSALSYYGFTDQLPKTIFYASTKYRKKTNNYKYATISKKRFFGYTRIGGIIIAEKEKAIVDSLLFPKYAGGIKQLISSIETSLKELDIGRLADYAVKMESKAVLRRLGFILELIGFKGNALRKISKKIGKGYERLEPSLGRRNNLNKRWLLDINDDINRRA